ncbi:MAG: hypothetical protein AB7O73_14415 [Bacteroidia bacterium]
MLNIFFLLGLVLTGFSQKIELPISNVKSTEFKNHLYVAGYKNDSCFVYKLDGNLKYNTTVQIKLSKSQKNHLSPELDTLHGTLNLSIQDIESKKADFYKLNDSLRILFQYKDFDITKINPLTGFQNQTLEIDSFYYVIRSAADTSGRQFYLSKFKHTARKETPFEYKLTWQFNFDKKYISSIKLLQADSNFVHSYVQIADGLKKGEWILRVNAKTGQLIKAHKFNKNKTLNYHYCYAYFNKEQKKLFVFGQVTKDGANDDKQIQFYIEAYDSLFENILSTTKTTQLLSPKGLKNKMGNILLQVNGAQYKGNGNYMFSLDYFESTGINYIYRHSSMHTFQLLDDEFIFEFPPQTIMYQLQSVYDGLDKNDLSGKLFVDSTLTGTIHTRKCIKPSKILFYTVNDMPHWILRHSKPSEGNTVYELLSPKDNAYQLKPIMVVPTEKEIGISYLNQKMPFVIYTNDNNKTMIQLLE